MIIMRKHKKLHNCGFNNYRKSPCTQILKIISKVKRYFGSVIVTGLGHDRDSRVEENTGDGVG